MPTDKFGVPFFHPSKAGGYFYQESDNPKNDSGVSELDTDFSVSGNVITMHCNGPTSFSIGRNTRSFTDSIGGCNMDFKATQARGYGYKANDVRDLEFKCFMKINGIGGNGFSISACTGHHSSSGCCQGFAYMANIDDTASNPAVFRFRKEMWHVSYHDSPEGTFTHSKANFKIDGHGWFGYGLCRYNDPADIGKSVILEMWFNPNPETDPKNWTMLKKIRDHPGNGWGNDGGKCNGASDQVGTWSNAHNRLKTNATSGTVNFKNITFREIDPSGSFDQSPPPITCPSGQHLSGGVCVPDTAGGGGDSGGGTGGGFVGSPLSYTYGSKFGSKGSGNGQFLDPHDISFEASGNLFICDRDRSDVQKFTPTGTYISKFGGSGSGNGQFNVPYSIQHDPTFAFIYVCDRDNNRVQKLNSSGTWISNITTVNGQAFNKPEDITFDKVNGDIYILDTGNDRCVKLNSAHTFILQWGTTGSGNGQFEHPHSVNTDSNRDVFISCGHQPYIQKFTSSGTFIKKWGSEGNNPGQVRMFLEHMDIDLHDRVHLVNNDVRPIVNVWNNQGVWITQYGKTTSGNANGQFNEPEHVTCDSTGKPYVVDANNQRIQVFNVNEPVIPPPSGGGTSGGGGGDTPPTITRVQGFLRLLWNINIVTGVGDCSGVGAGSDVFYNVTDLGAGSNKLDDGATGVYEMCNSDFSKIHNKLPILVDLNLLKVGLPTGTAKVVLRSAPATSGGTNDTIKKTFGTIDVSTISDVDYAVYSFGPITNTDQYVKLFNKIGIEYSNGNADNYVRVMRHDVDMYDGIRTCKVTKSSGKYDIATGMDMVGVFYEA